MTMTDLEKHYEADLSLASTQLRNLRLRLVIAARNADELASFMNEPRLAHKAEAYREAVKQLDEISIINNRYPKEHTT